jgi:serine kinase of HPr protein (carbohydrate metabolism regulator)
MTILSSETIHASCVSINDRAVLIVGPSGSGKSDLALRLIDRGALLVSDDYTIVRRADGKLRAGPPPNITGLIEVRGIGLVPMPFKSDVPVALMISLAEQVERLPDNPGSRLLAGVAVPVAALTALEASAPVKVEILLNQCGLA